MVEVEISLYENAVSLDGLVSRLVRQNPAIQRLILRDLVLTDAALNDISMLTQLHHLHVREYRPALDFVEDQRITTDGCVSLFTERSRHSLRDVEIEMFRDVMNPSIDHERLGAVVCEMSQETGRRYNFYGSDDFNGFLFNVVGN